MSDTYGDVDGSDDVAAAVAWQERIDAWPAIAAYKRRIDELCGDARPGLDVGAGPGVDAARAEALALDRSWAMACRARELGVAACVGDAHALPARTGAAGSVRCDRVLQHLVDPDRAMLELCRCLRPGGRLVIADPDQQTLTIAVPGVPASLIGRVRRMRRDVGYRNGTLASRLPEMLTAAGL